MAVTVQELLAKPFSCRSLEEQKQIIQSGKPRPVMNQMISFNTKKILIKDLYDKEIWLTACEKVEGVFCWICLLFSIAPGAEMKSFISKAKDGGLYKYILHHKTSIPHIRGYYEYRIFIKKNLETKVNPDNVQISSDGRNRAVLKRIIDVLCVFTYQTPPPSAKANNNCYPFALGKCIEVLLKSLKNYEIANITDEAIDFVKRYPKILTEIMEAIVCVMQKAIIQETQLCSYVSLILSEHSKHKKTSTVSSVIRYVYKGNVRERFINFKNFPDLKNAHDIETYMLGLVQDYKISSKIFSLSLDGAVLHQQFLSKLTVLLPSDCFFSPCYFHDFNYVLEQSLSNFEPCKFFFNVLNSMRTFFQDSAKNSEALNDFTDGKIIDLKNLKLDNSQFLRVLKAYRRTFVAFFSEIPEYYENGNGNDVSRANGYLHILQEYRVVFLIEAFYLLFNNVAILNETLSSSSPESAFDSNILDEIKRELAKERFEGFKKLWTFVTTEFATEGKEEIIKAVTEEEVLELRETFLKIVNCITEEIDDRFRCASKLEFLSFLNCEPHNKLVISDYQEQKIKNLPLACLQKFQTVKELKVLSKNGAVFSGKSVYGLMDILTKSELSETFKNVYRLAEIIETLPCKPIPHKTNVSKFHTINAWASIFRPENEFLSFLCIERDYLEYLSSRYDFYDSVILELLELSNEVKEMIV